LFFIPESPRYYAWNGRYDEAWKTIRRLHYEPSDPTDSSARAEFIQIVKQVESEKELNASMLQMFIRPSWRKRSIIAIFLLFASQSTGILGITNALVVIFSTLGMEGDMPLVMYAVYTTIGTFSVAVSIVIVDLVGRRRLFLIGYPLIALCLLTEALLQWKYVGSDSKVGNGVALAFIFVYIILYQLIE
jgi:hypothetical protein